MKLGPARLYKQERDETERTGRRLPMLTKKLLAAVGLAAALVLGVAGPAEARPGFAPVHHGPVYHGPVYRGPVYRAPVYRPVYTPVYRADRRMDWRRAEWQRHHGHDDRR